MKINLFILFAISVILTFGCSKKSSNNEKELKQGAEKVKKELKQGVKKVKKELKKDNVKDTKEENGKITDGRDGKVYKIVKIGEQTWMAENLNYTKNDGFQEQLKDTKNWKAGDANGWYYYDNKPENGKIYGALYQWKAATKACPKGWHLPTKKEWTQLSSYLKSNGYSYDVEKKRKIAKSLASDNGWKNSKEEGVIGNNDYPKFRNKSAFSALPAGNLSFGKFKSIGEKTYWWSSNDKDERNAEGKSLIYDVSIVYSASASKKNGLSVRCVKN